VPGRATFAQRFYRHRWPLFWGLVILVLVVAAGVWATDPLRRKSAYFEAPIHLVPGTVVRGSFLAEHDVWALELVFPREVPLDALGEAVGGGWLGSVQPAQPAGIRVRYVVRNLHDVRDGALGPREGRTGERFSSGWFGAEQVAVTLATFGSGGRRWLEFEAEVEAVSLALASRAAWLRAAPVGDWISYRGLEALARGVFACGAVTVVAIAFAVVLWVRRRKARAAAAKPPLQVFDDA
jgi:hypothetical protein